MATLNVTADTGDFRVNDDGGSAEQSHPRIAVAGDGSFAIIWSDQRLGQGDIFIQRFAGDAIPFGPNRNVNDDTLQAHQNDPALAVDISGRLSAVWTDYRNGGFPFDPDIFFQRFDSSLVPVASNRNLTTEWPDSIKEQPDIDLTLWGGGVVVWADYRNRNWDIYGQRVSAAGTLLGTNFRINNDVGSAQQHAPRVSVSPQGWFVVTWYDNRAGSDDIYVQVYDSLANPIGVNTRVSSDGSGARQAFPDLAADGSGRFTVVWVDWRNGTYPNNPDIYSRQYSNDLVPLTSEARVGSDPLRTAQRSPCIAADRKGNVAIIWADSVVGSWDITGQMIDARGEIREVRFRANKDADSIQVQPDVVLDGRYRYVTWTDKRNGNFDIYASVTKYNEPGLTVSPTSVLFIMDVGDTLPPSQTIEIDHVGFNPLPYTLVSSESWLALSKSSGITTDSVTLSIVDANLAFGTHLATITLVDTDSDDSTVVLPVRVDVTAPILEPDRDSLFFRAFSGIDSLLDRSVLVGNSGSGSFVWNATTTDNWISLTPTTGESGTTMNVRVNIIGLTAGDYSGQVIIDSPDALGSPDTISVTLELVDDLPYLRVTPESIFIRTDRPGDIRQQITISNAGTGLIDWQLSMVDEFLIADKTAGLGDDTVTIVLDTMNMTDGIYSTIIEITDSNAFNPVRRIPVDIELYTLSADTVWFGSTNLMPQSIGGVEVSISLSRNLTSLTVPFTYDSSVITFDSLIIWSELPSYLTASLYQPQPGHAYLRVVAVDSFLPPGIYRLGDLLMTAGSADALVQIGKGYFDTLRATLTTGNSSPVTPVVIPGEVQIGFPTSVDDSPEELIPRKYRLHQNYPNPFNATTIIPFDLPRLSAVKLELFNILGQRVVLLADAVYPAGRHQVVWSGFFDSGRSAPSGVYFFRLRFGSASQVGKMVLLK